MADSTRKLRPSVLARWQLDRDEERMRRMPTLLERKRARLEVSPFAFLRGTAPLFYRVLRLAPRLARGPDDEGWLCGDLHLENFGVYRPDRPARAERVAFDLNDVDEAFVGPLHLDVLRILTSTLLAARGWGSTASEALDLAGELLDGYRRIRGPGRSPPPPPPVAHLLAQVAARKRRALLDSRTRIAGHHRRFDIGARYARLSRPARSAIVRAFGRYGAEEAAREEIPAERFRVIDVAFRIAGTGSLGTFRVAVLVRGHGGRDGAWMFDLKAAGEPAGARFATRRPEPGPARVVEAVRTLLRRPPVMLGTLRALGHGLVVRRLTPQEDRLDWAAMSAAHRPACLAYLGALTGAAHRRGARRRLGPLRDPDARRLLDGAVELAGLHEATALAHAALSRR